MVQVVKCSSPLKFRCGKLKQKELMLSGRIIFGSLSVNTPANGDNKKGVAIMPPMNAIAVAIAKAAKNDIFEFPVKYEKRLSPRRERHDHDASRTVYDSDVIAGNAKCSLPPNALWPYHSSCIMNY